MSYRPRTLDHHLEELLGVAHAVAIEGPKGVGKTATASRRADTTWMLDDEDQRALLSADPSPLHGTDAPTLIDEWQRLPQVWDIVRRRGHLLWLKDRLGDDVVDLMVVTTGKYAYRRDDGVAVVPLALLGA